MIATLIAELSQAVSGLLAAGAGAAADHERLRRLTASLKAAGRKVPALVPLAADCERAVSGGPEAARALLDLSARLRPAQAALAAVAAPDGALSSAPPSGPWRTPLPAREAHELAALLAAKPVKGWEALARAVESHGGLDLRLVRPAAEAAVGQYGRTRHHKRKPPPPAWLALLADELEAGLNLHGDERDAWRLKVLADANPEAGRRLFRAALRGGASEPVLLEALRLLAGDPSAAELIPELARLNGHETHEIHHSAGWALVHVGPPAVPAMLEDLDGADPRRRSGAAWVLHMLLDYGSVRTAREGLLPELPRLRQALRRAGDEVSWILSLLRKLAPGDPETRRIVAEILRAEGDREMLTDPAQPPEELLWIGGGYRRSVLLHYLCEHGVPADMAALIDDRARRDACAGVRDAAVSSLGKLAETHPPALDLLLGLFHQRRKHNDCAAAATLGCLKEKALAALPRLTAMARGPDEARRLSALEALRYMGPAAAPAAEAVIDAARSGSKEVRGKALLTLGALGPTVEGVLPALIERASDPDEDVGSTALRELGRLRSDTPGLVEALAAGLDSPSERVRSEAMGRLCELKPPSPAVLAILVRLLRTREEPMRRRWAMEGMRDFPAGAPGLLPALESLLDDKDEWLRQYAAATLGRLRPRVAETVALLRRFLRDQKLEVQCSAATALGRIGALSGPALPALRKLADKHPRDGDFRKAVERIEKAVAAQ
jgi:HEAT repeat protein